MLARIVDDLAHIFTPRYSNNQKARILHVSSLLGMALLLVVFQVCLMLGAEATGGAVLGYAANISPEVVISLTNEERVAAGLEPLVSNSLLAQAALAKGTDMLNKDYWAHVSPDGVEPWYFFAQSGYEYRYAGENLARDFSNPSGAVDAWMASPSHRENLLSPRYREIGVAVVEGDLAGVDTTIIVQLFGTQATDMAAVPVAAAQGSAGIGGGGGEVLVGANELTGGGEESALVSTEGIVGYKRVSPLSLSKVVAFGLAGVLLLVLVLDSVVVAQKGISRVTGRVFAHVSFLGMVIAIILIVKAGRIL